MRLRARWAVVLALAGAAPAQAQEALLEPSAALSCLTPPSHERGGPEYPLDAWKRGQGGRVKVALEFAGDDLRPAVQVLESEGGEAFEDEVRRHVRAFRVPCLQGRPVPLRLLFEFVFRPDDRRVWWAEPVDADTARRQAQLACLKHVSGRAKPSYPEMARRNGEQGRALALLRFTSPDGSPQAAVHARRSASRLRSEIEQWVQGLRLPCLHGGPIEMSITYVFKYEDDPMYGFRPITLLQVLGSTRDREKLRLELDTTRMGCPFEVMLTYRRPDLPNRVGEIGQSVPARRPLLDWLATVELALAPEFLDAVYADTTTVHVPCARIDLKPKE